MEQLLAQAIREIDGKGRFMIHEAKLGCGR